MAGAESAVAELFSGGPVLCDGAMGTMLYGCGVFINRCYDELNVSQPDTVRSVHMQYLQAGARVLETNTFGANAVRLKHFDLQERVRELNLAGARIARQCVEAQQEKQATQCFVAGAIGPLGSRLGSAEGEIAPAQARDVFAEQIAALAEGGVDLLIVETMMSIAEAEQALAAAREVAPQLPAMVMMTVDQAGRCLDGATPAEAAARLTAAGARAVGCNCSEGPAIVLQVIEQMRKATDLPLVAMPNAGMPREVEGRNIYLTSPEYMASFAKKAVRAGATFVGGCCGTTPAHIRAMRGALRALEAQSSGETGKASVAVLPSVDEENTIEPAPMRERSQIGRMIAEGEFVTLVEIVPPKGWDCSKELAGAELLKNRGVHAINIPDSPRATARMSAQSLCVQVQAKVGIETVLHYTCRDRNLLSLQSDLLGVASLGLKNILCLTGDPPKMGDYPDATAVFDVDAIGLVNIVKGLNHGLDLGRKPILGGSTGFTLSVAANPGVPDLDYEVRRFEYKVQAGAEFAITQPVFDLRLLEAFLRRVEQFRIPVIAGIWPLTSMRNAEFMKNELKVSIPDDLLTRMDAASSSKEAGIAAGLKIAQEMLAAVRSEVQGVQVSAPFGRYATAAEVAGL